MKKAMKIIEIILLVLLIIAGSVVIWQWDNIKSVYIGLTKTEKEIIVMRNKNQENLIKRIDTYMDEPLRPLSEEEQQKIASGEATVHDVYLNIFEERVKEQTSIKEESKEVTTSAVIKEPESNSSPSEKKPVSSNKKKNATSDKKDNSKKESKPTKDEIVNKYMAQLYGLQSEFTARAESTISQGDRYYESLKKTQGKSAARSNTISHFTPIVRGVEAECDSRVAAVISNLRNELNAIGANTDIIGTIQATYENEKQLKLSYYTSRYLR